MKAVTEYYSERGWVTQDVSDRNRGWDIEAMKDDSVLKIEVKGLSSDTILIDMTPREYEQMKLLSDNSYHLCVLTNALQNDHHLYHFTYAPVLKELTEENGGIRLQIEEKVGARISVASY